MKFFRRKGIQYIPGGSASMNMSAAGIRAEVEKFSDLGKEFCLDVGSEKADGDTTGVNFVKFDGVELYGDVRCLFSPGYMDRVDEYPDLKKIPDGHFKLVKLVDFVEHLEWIHQEFLFRWIRQILCEGGLLYIVTPNFDYVVSLYLKAMKRLSEGKTVDTGNFPFHDHPYTDVGRPIDIVRWANSILYSGCSSKYEDDKLRGDFHHCMYNKLWIETMLADTSLSGGFAHIHVNAGTRLDVIAQKPYQLENGSAAVVGRMLNE